MPINKNELTKEQIDLLSVQEEMQYTIIGGENAVSRDIENELKQYGTVERISGENRYETSVNVAEHYYGPPGTAILVYGRNFPDGLFAGPLARSLEIPIILSARSLSSSVADYLHENEITSGYVLGGPSLIPDTTVRLAFSLPENTAIFAR